MLILEIFLGLVIAVTFYNVIHHFLVIIPNHKRQMVIKNKITRMMPLIFASLRHDRLIPDRSKYIITSKLLSKIWGRDIFAYEYVLNLNFSNKTQLLRFRNYFNETLSSYCKAHHMTNGSGMSLYLVADIWNYHHRTHLDIACVYNSATIDYLKDIHRL